LAKSVVETLSARFEIVPLTFGASSAKLTVVETPVVAVNVSDTVSTTPEDRQPGIAINL
jgi:hypothetical protein